MNLYTLEKVRQLEAERRSAKLILMPEEEARTPRKAIFGPLAAGVGGTLRRLGEGLESWSTPQRNDCGEHAGDTA
ncbi:MAG: hypothetical protein ABI559_07530 [Chloroflexota bacterium]